MKICAPLFAAMLFFLPLSATAQRTPVPIQPGDYECKISKEYKMRPCKVEVTETGATLTITQGAHLFHVSGNLHITNTKKKLFFEGKFTEELPFPCQYAKGFPDAVAQCKQQTLTAFLTKKGKSYTGKIRLMFYQAYYEGKVPHRKAAGTQIVGEEYLITIRPKKKK